MCVSGSWCDYINLYAIYRVSTSAPVSCVVTCSLDILVLCVVTPCGFSLCVSSRRSRVRFWAGCVSGLRVLETPVSLAHISGICFMCHVLPFLVSPCLRSRVSCSLRSLMLSSSFPSHYQWCPCMFVHFMCAAVLGCVLGLRLQGTSYKI